MTNINIIGCGVMGAQLACLFNIMGYDVNIWSRSSINLSVLERQKKILSRLLKSQDKKGKFTIIENFDELKNFITIECLAEDKNLKKNYSIKLSKIISKEIFTNTSSIKVSDISKNINLLHFFNPISMKIIEYFNFKIYSDEASKLIQDLKDLNFILIKVSDFTGYAFNKLLFNQISNFFFMIEKENISQESAIIILKNLNKDFDILNTIDLIGIDVCLRIIENLNNSYNTYVSEIFSKYLKKKILRKKNKPSIKTVFFLEVYPTKV